jgi:hypothetical protein
MKKIVFLAMIVFAAFSANSQSVVNAAMTGGTYSNALDTVSNTGSKNLVKQVPGSYKALSIVLVVTKISGTVGGSYKFQGSNDGTNYATLATDTLTDASAVFSYKEVDKAFQYYRVLVTGTGTMSASIKARLQAYR